VLLLIGATLVVASAVAVWAAYEIASALI